MLVSPRRSPGAPPDCVASTSSALENRNRLRTSSVVSEDREYRLRGSGGCLLNWHNSRSAVRAVLQAPGAHPMPRSRESTARESKCSSEHMGRGIEEMIYGVA